MSLFFFLANILLIIALIRPLAFIIALVALVLWKLRYVLLVFVIVVGGIGGTAAYLQWRSDEEQRQAWTKWVNANPDFFRTHTLNAMTGQYEDNETVKAREHEELARRLDIQPKPTPKPTPYDAAAALGGPLPRADEQMIVPQIHVDQQLVQELLKSLPPPQPLPPGTIHDVTKYLEKPAPRAELVNPYPNR